jgi:hypothetical protein
MSVPAQKPPARWQPKGLRKAAGGGRAWTGAISRSQRRRAPTPLRARPETHTSPCRTAFPASEPGIADDKLDSEKTPEAVLPPGCRRPVDLPPTARVVMRVCATRSGEYEGVREGDDEDETRSLLPQAQSPFLDGSGPSTSPFPPLPLQPVRTGQRTGALRHRS